MLIAFHSASGQEAKMTPSPQFDVTSAQWVLHRYDLVSDQFAFSFVPRAAHAEFPFLTDEYIGGAPHQIMSRNTALAAQTSSAPVHFIFHSAFCASTLLTRALDAPGMAMGMSEPVVLNDIVGLRRRNEMSGPELARLCDNALTLLARPWGTGEAVIIKPSNIVNGLAPAILALRPDSKAIALYAPLPQFLLSVARKGLWCRLWVRELLEGLLREGAVQLGFEDKDYFRLTDLQVAAVGWLAQHAMFHRLLDQYGPKRIVHLSSEDLISNPLHTIAALTRHFGLGARDDQIAAIASGPAFNRHSKTGAKFDSADRAAERRAAMAAHYNEIEKVTEWAKAVAQNAGLNLALPHPLTR